MATIPYHLRDWTWGIVVSNTGTLGDANSFADTALTSTASTQIPTDATIEIKKSVNQRRPNRANGYRQNWHLDATQDDKGLAPSLSWSCEASKVHLPFVFAGLFQSCIEGASTPYVKTFKWPTLGVSWSTSTGYGYPIFSSDQGYYFGFIENSPVTSADVGILSCVPTEATLSISSEAPNNDLMCSSNWIGTLTQDTSFSATTPTPYAALTKFNFDDMSVKIGGTADLVCYGWSITITPGFIQIPTGGAGCQGIAMGPHKVTGYIDILYDSNARVVFQDLGDDGNGFQTQLIEIWWGAGNDPVTTDGELRIELNAQFSDTSNQGSEARIRRLTFECVKDATYEDIQIQIADAVDRVWQG